MHRTELNKNQKSHFWLNLRSTISLYATQNTIEGGTQATETHDIYERSIVASLSKLKRRRSEKNCPFCAINHSLNLNTDTEINYRFVIDTFAMFYTAIKFAVQRELVTSIAFCIISLSPIGTSYHGTRPMLNGLLFVEYVTSALKLVRFHCFDAIAFECFIVCVCGCEAEPLEKRTECNCCVPKLNYSISKTLNGQNEIT